MYYANGQIALNIFWEITYSYNKPGYCGLSIASPHLSIFFPILQSVPVNIKQSYFI